MKISLITMHRVPNYGSVLQTYATSEVLRKMGHSVEVLDFIPSRLRLLDTILAPAKDKSKLMFPAFFVYSMLVNIPKLKMYSNFLKKYLKLTPRSYSNIEEIKKDLPIADIYMTGSDQVWNTFYDGFIDPIFFLDFVPSIGKKKISYAASFGRGTLSVEESNLLKDYILSYDALSVRESSGVEIIKKMGRSGVEHVLDPTFLLDKNDWSTIATKTTFKEKYVLMYTVNKDEHRLMDLVTKIAKAKNLKIYYLHNGLKGIPGCDRIFRNQTPNDFLSLFAQAEYVIATSFHGTAFAINFNKPFISVLPEKFRTRVESILALTGLEDRMIRDDFSLEIALSPIDYVPVNAIIAAERQKSLQFLKSNID